MKGKLLKHIFLTAVLLALVPSVMALTSTTVRSAIGTDYADWGDSGNEFAYLGTSFTASSQGGIGMTVSGSQYGFIRYNEGSGWIGNFAIGDRLLYTDMPIIIDPTGATPPIPVVVDIAFDKPVYGAGAQIQPDWYGDFLATLTVKTTVGDSTWYFNGSSNGKEDNTAIFAGVVDDKPIIERMVFSVNPDPDISGFDFGFAINQLQVRGQYGVPEGANTGGLFLLTLLALLVGAQAVRKCQLA